MTQSTLGMTQREMHTGKIAQRKDGTTGTPAKSHNEVGTSGKIARN